ncbi:hypothetical protein GCM10022218_12060 [Sphingobacterium ginsenosidimutans]|uniref:Uncharacterized protein n=1 Tax=Sphingobacterium ginsenosidimutans TaxID=687845 RepID=A0ABP7ZVT4_9SPHI
MTLWVISKGFLAIGYTIPIYNPVAGGPDEFMPVTFVNFTSTSNVPAVKIDHTITIANGIT